MEAGIATRWSPIATTGLELVRQRDGEQVLWDLLKHRAIDHGYTRRPRIARKSRTVDAVFALASTAEARRGLYVDVTRARAKVTVAYGKDEVQTRRALSARAAPDNGKVLVRDVLRDVALPQRHGARARTGRKRLRAVALKLEREQKIDRGPKIDRDCTHDWQITRPAG